MNAHFVSPFQPSYLLKELIYASYAQLTCFRAYGFRKSHSQVF